MSLLKKSPPSNPILERCRNDSATKLRLKYRPYYRSADANQGIEVTIDGRKLIMFSSNEYLGLSQHPRVVAAAQKALMRWGTAPCGSRLANGSRAYQIELEEALADFLGKEACHITATGYLACMCGLTALAQRGDTILVDQSIHSALWDGINLSAADHERFAHEDVQGLGDLLNALPSSTAKLIAVDGVYSMEGHIASLPEICALAGKHQAFVLVDDAHGFGVLGRGGRGTSDHHQVTDQVHLIVGTFSKSLASTGGFVAGDRAVIEFLRSHSRQIIFSAATPPAACAAALESLRILQEEPEHLEKLWSNTRLYHKLLVQIGADFWNSPTPAVPIVIGQKERAYMLWEHLWKKGFFTTLILPPGVPAGKDLIRTSISSLHTPAQIEQFVAAIGEGLKQKSWF